MTDEQAQAYQDAEDAARKGVAELLERVADKMGGHVGVSAAFGEPVEREGVTVIPVAQTIVGTGAGGGRSPDDESGVGAGGGAVTRPLGYIEIDAAGARFVPLRPAWLSPGVMLTVVLVTLVLSRTLVRLAGR